MAFVPANSQLHLLKIRAKRTPQYCRFKQGLKSLFLENMDYGQYFSLAWTPFLFRPEIAIARLANGVFFGVF
jgi:hypothetical protein